MGFFYSVVSDTNTSSLENLAHKLNGLTPLLLVCALALFIGIPFGLYGPWGDFLLLSSVGALYVSILLALLHIFSFRCELSLKGWPWVSLILETVLCSPYSLNLKANAATRVNVDALSAAKCLLCPEDQFRFKEEVLCRIASSIEDAEAAGKPSDSLQGQRNFIEEIFAHEH